MTTPYEQFTEEISQRTREGDVFWAMVAMAALSRVSPEQTPDDVDARALRDWLGAGEQLMEEAAHIAMLPEDRQRELIEKARKIADEELGRA